MVTTVVRRLSILGACLLVATCTRRTPEQQLVQDVADALGGAAAVQRGAVLRLEGTGRQYNLGQDLRPGLADQTFTVSAYTREYDLAVPRLRVTQTRTPNFAYFQGPQAQTQVQGVDGEVAYNASGTGTASRVSNATAADRRAERYHHPLPLLRAALADGAKLSLAAVPAGVVGAGEQAIAVDTEAGSLALVVDAKKRPLRIVSMGSHINLGDVRLTTTFANYAAAGALRLPGRIATMVDDFTTGTYDVTSTVADTGAVTAPAQAAGAPEPPPPAVNVTTEEVAPGVWFLAGQSHHSVVVAFKDRLVLIEAPQSEARSLAVIRQARALRPDTPLTHVVMSHHHFDHSTGLRAAIAEGLTIVTHEGNAAFVREMAARPFTGTPDTLAKRQPPPLMVETVAASHTITDGTRTLELYHLAGNPHSDTLLMAHLPAERLLVEVDAFSPGGTYHPYAANLLEHITRLKLRVDRILPLHGSIVTMKDLAVAVTAR